MVLVKKLYGVLIFIVRNQLLKYMMYVPVFHNYCNALAHGIYTQWWI